MNSLTIHALFGDRAVLQRERRLPVWGTARPGSHVEVALAGRVCRATTSGEGRWMVSFDPLPAGGPHTINVTGDDGTVVSSRDVLIGDVFLCSGQSNMEWVLRDSAGGAEAAAAAADPMMRLMTVPRRASALGMRNLDASWMVCGPDTAPAFSAVAFYGGRALRRACPGVPVGMIGAAWGGTRIEPWISPAGLQAFPRLYDGLRIGLRSAMLERTDREAYERALNKIRASFADAFNRWHKQLCDADGGEAGGFASSDHDISGWQDRTVPGHWPDKTLGNHEGVVWFACDVDVPAGWGRGNVVLHLGEVDNEDTTWLNGVRLGGINALDGAEHWSMQRDYSVPAGLLRAGKNRLVVRVIDYGGRGGMAGSPHGMCFQRDSGEKILLPGQWKIRVGSGLLGPRIQYPAGWSGGVDSGTPGALFGGMIAPLVPAALAGIWWYQGESNVGEAIAYRDLMKALVVDWRRLFSPGLDPEFIPFCWVQLTAFTRPNAEPDSRSGWALLREAQTMALALPSTGQAVIIDCGDPDDVHPRDKRSPGERLAAIVRDARGDRVPFAGPRFAGIAIVGGTIRVGFTCTGRLRTVDGKPVGRLAICGDDRIWRWAETRLDGHAVFAWHREVAKPVAVRYAWADNPEGANLTDDTGLPAWPFRSDDWAEA